VVVAAAVAALGGCASLDVVTDWDRQTSFGAFKTFAFTKGLGIRDPTIRDSIERAVSVEMENAGFRPVDSEAEADLLVAVHGRVATDSHVDIATFGYDYWWGGYGATVAVRDVEVGTLIVDVVDGKAKKLVFRSIATASLPKEAGTGKRLFQALDRMFADFPPAAGG
jgi:hypothetical protein